MKRSTGLPPVLGLAVGTLAALAWFLGAPGSGAGPRTAGAQGSREAASRGDRATSVPGVSGPIRNACLDALPDEIRAASSPGGSALEGRNASGSWRIHPGEMDGSGANEAILVVTRPGRRVQILFFAERAGKSPQKKKISLGGRPVEDVVVRFQSFMEGRSLAHVEGPGSGQVLLHWNGKKLEKVWEVKSHREDERFWFVLEDLDGDAVREVISWVQREVDVFFVDETEEDEEGGGDERGATDPIAVHRFEEGRWKKSSELLEGIR